MTVASQIMTLSIGLNDTLADLEAAFNAAFLPILTNISSIDVYGPTSPAFASEVRLRISYVESSDAGAVGLQHFAVLFQTDQTQTAAEKFNDYYAAGVSFVPLHFLDLTYPGVTQFSQDALLVIGAITNRALAVGQDLIGHDDSVFIAQPVNDINPSAAGACDIFDARGEQIGDAIQVHNTNSANVWLAGQRSFCSWDPQSGQLISLATCDLVVPPPPPPPPPADPAPDTPCPSRSSSTSTITVPRSSTATTAAPTTTTTTTTTTSTTSTSTTTTSTTSTTSTSTTTTSTTSTTTSTTTTGTTTTSTTTSTTTTGTTTSSTTTTAAPLAPCTNCTSPEIITLTEHECPLWATMPEWSGFSAGAGTCSWQWFDVFNDDFGTIVDLVYDEVGGWWELTISNIYDGVSESWIASQDPVSPQGSLLAECNDLGLSVSANLVATGGSGCSDIQATI